jgi:hypothetical protein
MLLVTTVAPTAMADHCVRCKISMTFECNWGTLFGRTDCFSDGFSCTLSGPQCNHQQLAPLAADFTVASVERIDQDEPKTNAAPALVAELAKPAATPAVR